MMAFMPVNCWKKGMSSAAEACFQWRRLYRMAMEPQKDSSRVSCAFLWMSSTSFWMSWPSGRNLVSTCAQCGAEAGQQLHEGVAV